MQDKPRGIMYNDKGRWEVNVWDVSAEALQLDD